MLECDKETCQERYIGETERAFYLRVNEHIGYARTGNLSKTTGYHFNQPGHSWHNMKFSIIEQVKSKDRMYREGLEKYHTQKVDTFYNSMNRMP